jgi:hypothetical protein
MTRGRNLVLTIIVVALFVVSVSWPDILLIDGTQVLADPGGHHGGN